MRIVLRQPFKSLVPFETSTDVPEFLVLTGANGAGKTQLLEVLEDGRATIESMRIPAGVEYPGGILVRNAELDSPYDPMSPRRSSVATFNAEQYEGLIVGRRFENKGGQVDEERLRELSMMYLRRQGYTDRNFDELSSRFPDQWQHMTGAELADHLPLMINEDDPFGRAVLDLFVQYMHRSVHNRAARAVSEAVVLDGEALSDEDFLQKYGPPPWEFLNEILAQLDIDFRFVAPIVKSDPNSGGFVTQQATVSLLDESTRGLTTNDLSTGERTLLRVALALFNGKYVDADSRWKPVLLMDEPDAFLHPKMVRSLIAVIRDLFVGRFNISVVITTHSPTTVALVPEDSLYVMRRGFAPAKVGRDAAIRQLLQGVPTVNVDAETRRTVFVESDTDASIHTLAYTVVAGDVDSPFSPQFVGLGGSNSPSGGRSIVANLVSELRAKGTPRVWGLVDRDSSPPTVSSLVAPQERYTVENYALDPLSVGVYLLSKDPALLGGLGFDLATWAAAMDVHSQTIVDLVSRLAFDPYLGDAMVTATYCGGFDVSISRRFFEDRGHALCDRFVERFDALQAIKAADRSAGSVAKVISRSVWKDYPEIVPLDLLNTYRILLAPEAEIGTE